MEKNGEKYCIFRPELPTPPGAQCRFASETKQMPQQVVSYQSLTDSKYEGKFLMTISNFAQALATFALNPY